MPPFVVICRLSNFMTRQLELERKMRTFSRAIRRSSTIKCCHSSIDLKYFVPILNHGREIRLFSSSSSYNARFTEVLPFRRKPFNSIEINADEVYFEDSSEFGVRLALTLSTFRRSVDDNDRTDAIYLDISISNSHLISIAGAYGFKFHHAEGDIATMLLWLPDFPCKVGAYRDILSVL